MIPACLAPRLMSISPDQTRFDVRGFHQGSRHAMSTLEGHGASFVAGYNTALATESASELASLLDAGPARDVGFAYEGAAMAWALCDLVRIGDGQRLQALLNGPGRPHIYMVHVGAGWALARLRLRPRRRL